MIIGVTGGSGAGKSLVSAIFAEYGYKVIDADKIARNIMDTDKNLVLKIEEVFGKEYITEDGRVDRKKLGANVFENSEKRELLNSLTHPAIYKEMKKQMDMGQGDIVLDIPLLIGTDFTKECDVIISVMADRKLRIKRITERDGVTYGDAENRINSQLTDRQYIEGSDYQIYNNGDEKEIREKIIDFIKRYGK